MKKIVLGIALAAAASSSFAAKYGPAGCGLGSTIFSGASSLPEHVLAATTNGTSGNQTFGMTSGTSGCDSSDSAMAGVQSYMDQNMEQLAADAARGEGEALQALIALIGVDSADQVEFTQSMQTNFDKIFMATATTSGDAFASLTEVMAANDKLVKYLG